MRFVRKASSKSTLATSSGNLRKRDAGFTLAEMMVVVALLVLFAAASIVTLMATNQSAIASRNKTLARMVISEQLNEIMARTEIEAFEDEPVILWQIGPDGENVQVDGQLTMEIAPDGDEEFTQEVTITLEYTYGGRDVEHVVKTIHNTAKL
jgi:prepilin-type N-terminal cleavage/methylation domain-containing protein